MVDNMFLSWGKFALWFAAFFRVFGYNSAEWSVPVSLILHVEGMCNQYSAAALFAEATVTLLSSIDRLLIDN